MYEWRKMSEEERAKTLAIRKGRKLPWHAPPRFEYEGKVRFIITSSCYEHKHIIGFSPERMAECENELLKVCNEFNSFVYAWCILPNHYHLLVQTDDLKRLRKGLGSFHGRTSFQWNNEENKRGRKVWFRCLPRAMRSSGHFWASLNYVNNNAVHHGYVKRWQDWAYSSANSFLEKVGREKAIEIWHKYPVLDYGKDWDIY